MNIYVDPVWILAVVSVLALTGLVSVAMYCRRLGLHQKSLAEQKQQLEVRIQSLERKIEFLNTGSLGIGQRLMNTEKRLHQALERQEDLSQNQSENLYRRQADRMLKSLQLSDTDEDEDSPSRSEAKLMALVSKRTSPKS